MNKKFLLSTVAVASMLAACTQDEALEIPQAASQAQRPVAGIVEFTNPQTRFNEKLSKFEKGDAFGAYLMDEFDGYYEGGSDNGSCWKHEIGQGGIGERPNANLPVNYWKYQSNFQWMYTLVNYVNSNYKYTLNEELSAWENPGAQLVEGNYLLMFPQNEKITNRRELWFTINPEINLELVKASTQYHVGLKNQVYLGYSQIYRNDEASDNGVFKIPANLHSVMSIAEIAVKNQSNTDFEIEKIVMKNKYGYPVPTLAYVKPAAGPNDGGSLYSMLDYTNDVLKGQCDVTEGVGLLKENCFDQEDARAITHWATTADGHIPYGLDEEAQVPVYEYTINFPKGTILKDNRQDNQKASQTFAYISLPPSSPEFDYNDIEVIIYGKKFDSVINHGEGGWVDGMLTTQANTDNQVFTLDQLLTWNEGMDVPQVTCKFDDESFKQIENFAVKTTDELLTLVQGRLDDNTTTKNMDFKITAYGNGLEVTQEVVDMIDAYEEAHNVTITMEFGAKNGTPIILKDKNIFDRFDYRRVTVICEADQTIAKKNRGGVAELNIDKDVTVTIKNVKMTNCTVDNHGTLITTGADITTVCNDATMKVTGNTKVGSLSNDNDCVNCGKGLATVTIENATLTVGYLNTAGNGEVYINNNGVLSTSYGNNYIQEHKSIKCSQCGETLETKCGGHNTGVNVEAQAAANDKNIKTSGNGVWKEKKAVNDAKAAGDKAKSECESTVQHNHDVAVANEWNNNLNHWNLTGDALKEKRIGASQFVKYTGETPTYKENKNQKIAVKAGSTLVFKFKKSNKVNPQLSITIGDETTVYNISNTDEGLTITLTAEQAAIIINQGLIYNGEKGPDAELESVTVNTNVKK